jgi:hypothetical protein
VVSVTPAGSRVDRRRAPRTGRQDEGVELAFTGPVIEWRGPAPYFYVVVPESVSAEVQDVAAAVSYGWGAVPVEASIDGTRFTTSLFPKDGRYLLPLRDAVRKALGISVEDHVAVTMRVGRD